MCDRVQPEPITQSSPTHSLCLIFHTHLIRGSGLVRLVAAVLGLKAHVWTCLALPFKPRDPQTSNSSLKLTAQCSTWSSRQPGYKSKHLFSPSSSEIREQRGKRQNGMWLISNLVSPPQGLYSMFQITIAPQCLPLKQRATAVKRS